MYTDSALDPDQQALDADPESDREKLCTLIVIVFVYFVAFLLFTFFLLCDARCKP
jgi:hypothetical protein